MSASDYLFFRTVVGSDKTTQTSFVATGATGVTLISARNALTHLNIQRVRYAPTTFATGALLFVETNATGAAVGDLAQPAAQAVAGDSSDQIETLDFGPKGWKMGAGKDFFMTRSATGSAGDLIIEAYETVSTGPLAIATTN